MAEGMLEHSSHAELSRLLTDYSFVEFETAADLRTAVEKLDGLEFKGQQVQCVADVNFPYTLLLTIANIA